MRKSRRPRKLQFSIESDYFTTHRCIVISAMLDSILEEGYYNCCCDTYSCTEIAVYDALYKLNHKVAENYKAILDNYMKQYDRWSDQQKEKQLSEERIDKLAKELFK